MLWIQWESFEVLYKLSLYFLICCVQIIFMVCIFIHVKILSLQYIVMFIAHTFMIKVCIYVNKFCG